MNTNAERQIGTEIFQRMNDNVPERYAELNRKVWTPTPWMVDVFSNGLDQDNEFRNWLCHHFGPESSPIHGHEGCWHQANVTIHGYCWYGFATEELMKRFITQFPSPPRPSRVDPELV